eukprot:TRINITY_DN11239_c2_g1_i1.p1 TRINITY_DN11239_c2_g1~~TRINITY_DN11239_c2_g1_i1.p1  ORF type:complete len:760 (-),score=93.30 TRINITY_DN11239_c2_g1_i1:127-2169(-)
MLVSVCLVERTGSKPRLYEAFEIVFWCVLASLVHADLVLVEDITVRQQYILINALLPCLVPAFSGVRFWSYMLLVSGNVAVNSVTLWYMASFQGESLATVMFPYAALGALLGIVVSACQNAFMWKMWTLQSDLSFEKAALESLSSVTLDATCWLSDELGTVSTCDRRVEDVFQVDLSGSALTDVVASEEERSHVARALVTNHGSESSFAPVILLPVTVNRSSGPVKLELLIVRREDCARGTIGVSQRQRRDRLFFVGIRYVREDDRLQNDDSNAQNDDDLADVSDQSEGHVDVEDDHVCVVADEGGSARSNLSLPRTTRTGRIFKAVGRQDDVGRSLEEIKALIEKERWFIPPDEVKVSKDCVVGEGSFGSVVIGSLHGTLVVVKLPRFDTAFKGLKQVSNELRILRHARHPNLVQCFGAAIDMPSWRFGLVLEFVRGANLCRIRFNDSDNRGHAQRCEVIEGVIAALSYLHSRKPVVVHGDLKPENVLVEVRGSDMHPKLVDFGLSRLLTTSAKPLGGTLQFMAPEVARPGRKRPNASADVFSLGYLIYFTTTGAMPYAGLSRDEIKELHRLGVIADLSWSVQSPYETMAKNMAEKCLQPLQQRPSIKEVFCMLTTFRNRDKSAREFNDTFQNFADMDLANEPTPSDHGIALESIQMRTSNLRDGADTPIADPRCRLAL